MAVRRKQWLNVKAEGRLAKHFGGSIEGDPLDSPAAARSGPRSWIVDGQLTLMMTSVLKRPTVTGICIDETGINCFRASHANECAW